MKKFLVLCVFAVTIMFTGCMKEYDDEVSPAPNPNPATAPYLKVTGATMSGDTAYAAPAVYLKFWLDSLPLAVSSYTFSWNLDGGDYATVASPEKKYDVGVYSISVVITPISGGSSITRNIILVVKNSESWETTLVLLSSTPVAGNKYDYEIAMRTTAIYNYANISSDPWDRGDFTGWEFNYLTETVTMNGILYIIDHIILPADEDGAQRFTYGKGGFYAYAPQSQYWVVTAPGEGVFEVYLTNGQMSSNPVGAGLIPGDNGDLIGGAYVPTIRTEVKYSGIPLSDSLRIYVNYTQYANGPKPFIARMLSNDNWQNIALVLMGGDYAGWGYQTFAIKDLANGLYFRFGPSLTSPTAYGQMDKSKFFLPGENMLGLQITGGLKSGAYEIRRM